MPFQVQFRTELPSSHQPINVFFTLGCVVAEDIAEPDSWTDHSKVVHRCSDELCLVGALLARTPFIIIEQDIAITGKETDQSSTGVLMAR